jgi:hypothetical protein
MNTVVVYGASDVAQRAEMLLKRRLLNEEKIAIQELSKHFLSAKLAMFMTNEGDHIINKAPIAKLYKLFKGLDDTECGVMRDAFVTMWEVLYGRPFLKRDKEKICQQIALMLETEIVSSAIEELCHRGYELAISWGVYGNDIRTLHNPMS